MTQTKTWPDREAVAKIVEAAIADTLSMHWVTARDNATDAILALFPPPDDGWVLVPREPTDEMIEAARRAKLAPDYTDNHADGLPIWDNMDAPGRSDVADWEAVFPGITKPEQGFFHPSYEWPEWQIHLFKTAYRAMLSAAPTPEGEGRAAHEGGGQSLLVEAAPDLLEALKACLSALDGLMGDTDPLDETPALLACQAASAAIAKALPATHKGGGQ